MRTAGLAALLACLAAGAFAQEASDGLEKGFDKGEKLAKMAKSCQAGSAKDCPDGSVCMLLTDQNGCRPIPAEAPLADLGFPFEAGQEAVCTHSSGSGSHSSTNAFYAIDLATPYDQDAAVVHAVADGKAFIFGGEDGSPCPEPEGGPDSAKTSPCGDSWGNRVKILHSGGYFSFYCHLDHFLIEDGAAVKKGQAIGVEGWTGLAGHRHVHWSVQKLPGDNQAYWEKHIAWMGDSVPFQFEAIVDGTRQTVDAATFSCPHANIGKAGDQKQPRLKAVGSKTP